MKRLLASLLFTIVLAAPAVSWTMDMPIHEQHREGHGQMMSMGSMDRMGEMMGICMEHADRIGLTDDQLKKMKPAHREMQKKQARFKADLKVAEIEFMEIMEVKDFDLEKAGTAVEKIADIKTAHQLEMLDEMKAMRTLLTDDQFKKMQAMMSMNKDVKKPSKRMMKKQK